MVSKLRSTQPHWQTQVIMIQPPASSPSPPPPGPTRSPRLPPVGVRLSGITESSSESRSMVTLHCHGARCAASDTRADAGSNCRRAGAAGLRHRLVTPGLRLSNHVMITSPGNHEFTGKLQVRWPGPERGTIMMTAAAAPAPFQPPPWLNLPVSGLARTANAWRVAVRATAALALAAGVAAVASPPGAGPRCQLGTWPRVLYKWFKLAGRINGSNGPSPLCL